MKVVFIQNKLIYDTEFSSWCQNYGYVITSRDILWGEITCPYHDNLCFIVYIVNINLINKYPYLLVSLFCVFLYDILLMFFMDMCCSTVHNIQWAMPPTQLQEPNKKAKYCHTLDNSLQLSPFTCVYIHKYIHTSVCQRAFSLLAIWCLGSRVQILHSAEEYNLSSFDLNIACLCQSIEINNNKYVYRQSQVRKSTDNGVKWAECSLIIGTGCRVQAFSLIFDSSVRLSASIQSAGDLVPGIPGSNPSFSRGIQLVFFWFEYRLPVPEHRN